MTRPIDETWSCDGGCIDMDAPSVVHRIGSFGQSSAVQAETDRNEARARLAAQAPEMARLLLSEGMWHHAECVVCGGHRHQGGHATDCALVAVLRAAGVVE